MYIYPYVHIPVRSRMLMSAVLHVTKTYIYMHTYKQIFTYIYIYLNIYMLYIHTHIYTTPAGSQLYNLSRIVRVDVCGAPSHEDLYICVDV